MIVRVVSSHPKQEGKRERAQQCHGHSLDKVCKSIRGITSHQAYVLKRDRRVEFEDIYGWTHLITIEEENE